MWSRLVKSQVKHNSYFIVGMAVGLWVSLALVPLEEEPAVCAPAELSGAGSSPASDEYEPRREDKPLGSGGVPAGRPVQRPRYYTTELGIRGSLLAGVLSSEEALREQVPALNRTLARLQPALRFFITASAMSAVPGLANVVGFTDTREILKPFHALKYLADNYLEEYDFFFLITDKAFVNARRLAELTSRLSVSQDVYMGRPASPGSPYCSLEAGVLLSSSVLRAVHAELEWCVRNSYSPHHHENLGRCVLHAAHVPCVRALQGETYTSVSVERADGADALRPALWGAVSARPVRAAALPALHAYVARGALERGAAESARLRAALWRTSHKHPPGYRNTTWPAGLRAEPGLRPPPPESRFAHLRWTLFNSTHAYMPDEVRAVAPLDSAHRRALQHVMEAAGAWARRRWAAAGAGASHVALVEGARQWEPAAGLRYRLLVELRAPDGGGSLRALEVVRGVGGARLVPVRYVTESARLSLVVPASAPRDALDALAAYEQVALLQDKNTHLYLVWVGEGNETAAWEGVRAVAARHPGAALELAAAAGGGGAAQEARAALRALAPRLAPDALVLLVPPHARYNQDALNRVRMNTIAGVSWFLPMPFARYSSAARERAHSATGRFAAAPRAPLLALYKADLDAAERAWSGSASAPLEAVLAASALRCVRAPEPGLVLAPRPAPCPAPAPAPGPAPGPCLRRLERDRFQHLDLGTRTSLAHLLLDSTTN